MARYLYSEFSKTISAYKRCVAGEWAKRHQETLDLLLERMPSGSGLDNGVRLDLDSSHEDKLIFNTEYHHMNDGGYYDGWTSHSIVITPSLSQDFHIRVTGRDRNEVKEYIAETFSFALQRDVTYWLFLERFPEFAVHSKWEDKDGTPSQCYQAFYSNGVRFWNDWDSAEKHSAQLMEDKFYKGPHVHI